MELAILTVESKVAIVVAHRPIMRGSSVRKNTEDIINCLFGVSYDP